MEKPTTSVIIPVRDPRYLQKTIDDILVKFRGSLEIIVVLDGIWLDPMLKNDPRVIIVHHGVQDDNPGMRASINAGVSVSRGTYIMKTDNHVMFDEGFDDKIIADYQEHDIVIPRRYRLDPDKWVNIEDGRPPIDYMYVANPFLKPGDFLFGFHGAIWNREGREEFLIDETPSFQGSFWFMSRKHWDEVIKEMDDENYGPFTQEAQELGFKTWLSGGRVVVNKKTWHSHWHKGKEGKGYGFTNAQYKEFEKRTEIGRKFCIKHWLTTGEHKQTFKDFMNRFPDMPGWTPEWENGLAEKLKQLS